MTTGPECVIVGAGALGQSFAALLAQQGQSVTLLGTRRGVERLTTAGAIRLCGAIDTTVPIDRLRLTSDPRHVPEEAALLFTTKGHDLPAAIDALRTAAARRVAWTAGVQNGVLKDDLLRAAFGAERTVGAATIFGAQRQPDGSVRVGSRGMTYLGEHSGHLSDRVQQAALTLAAAGVPTQARGDIASVLWSKACNATGVFGVAVLARCSNQRLFSDRHLMRAYLVLIRETAAVAAACGASVGNYAAFPPIRTFLECDAEETLAEVPEEPDDGNPPAYASMTHDLLAGRPLEVDAVFGDIVARADQHNVPVPCLRLVRDLLRALDPGRLARQSGGFEAA